MSHTEHPKYDRLPTAQPDRHRRERQAFRKSLSAGRLEDLDMPIRRQSRKG